LKKLFFQRSFNSKLYLLTKMSNNISNKKQKAVLINDGKPSFREIGKVKLDDNTGNVYVTLKIKDGDTKPVDAKKNQKKEKLKLLSDDTHEKMA